MKKSLSHLSFRNTFRIIAGLLIILSSCKSPTQKQEDAGPSLEDKTTKEVESDSIHATLDFGNDRVELKIDAKTGFLRDIFCKETGIHHKDLESGIWPFGMRMGDSYSPNLLRVQIDGSPKCADQQMDHEIISGDDQKTLRMYYENMKTTGGNLSGIQMTVDITLRDGSSHFLITADIENKGKYNLTSLFSGWGGLVAGESREEEHLAVPDWSLGTEWKNPSQYFQHRETFGYPIFGSQGTMVAGWIDLYGKEGGIGIGYLNRQELAMYFNVHSQPAIPNRIAPPREKGIAFNWQLFNLLHDKTTETLATVSGVYPVRPGERFKTDVWILAPHTGDWHAMADIYRQEYENVFAGDFLTWEDTQEEAKKIDLTTYCSINLERDGIDKIREVPGIFDSVITRSKIEPENIMVNILALWQHPLYWPDHFPCGRGDGEFATSARNESLSTVARLRERGVDAILFFTHLFYNHPKARDYIAGVSSDYDHQNVIWNDIGEVACVNEKAWQDLWKNNYIPGYEGLDASGVMLDQGPTQYLVCSNEDHSHGTDAVAMLSSFNKGTYRQLKAFRDGFKTRQCLLWTECASDLSTRLCDIWSGWDGYPEEPGGFRNYEIVRYTFPYRLYAYTAFIEDWTITDVNRCLVDAFLLGGYYGFDAEKQWPEMLDAAVHQYIRIRRELREKGAPGYPQGFIDTVGLSVGDEKLVARLYRGDEGATVVYYAAEDVTTTITVDGKSIDVSLKKDEAAYTILQ